MGRTAFAAIYEIAIAERMLEHYKGTDLSFSVQSSSAASMSLHQKGDLHLRPRKISAVHAGGRHVHDRFLSTRLASQLIAGASRCIDKVLYCGINYIPRKFRVLASAFNRRSHPSGDALHRAITASSGIAGHLNVVMS